MMALEIAMDEMAERLKLDPIEFRSRNDTQVDPEHPNRPFSQRQLVQCMRMGAERFGWNARLPQPGRKLAARVDKKFERIEKETPIPAGMGRLELAGAPWGEVLLDGKRRGVSPTLRFLDVAPGAHTIEIRNSTFPAHVERIQVKAGEAVRVRHRFR